jgi:transketolase
MLVADPGAAQEYERLRRTTAGDDDEARVEALRDMAAGVRRDIVGMIDRAQLGHIGGDLSVTDILVTLFGAVLDVDPQRPDRPDRDRFVLSKGHCAAALYATLAHCGFFARRELETFMAPLSMLNGHPDRKKVPGVETNTGPLGHGFPVAVGCALAAQLRGASWRTVVVLGDGELLEPLADKWAAFGFEVRDVDGHDHRALLDAFSPSATGKPVAVIANTIKGKGVSFIEDRVEWHHKVPSAEQVQIALEELAR